MGKLTRTRVIINKTSLEQLVELNNHAEKLGCFVSIGVSVEGEPHYRIQHDNTDSIEVEYGYTKEEVLQKIIGLAKHGGLSDET